MSKWKIIKTGNFKEIIRGYFAQLYANTFENLDEINTRLKKYSLPNIGPSERYKKPTIQSSMIDSYIDKVIKINCSDVPGHFERTFPLKHYPSGLS